MLGHNSFTPGFSARQNLQKQYVEELVPKVKFPLLFEITKNDRRHYAFGTYHLALEEEMPACLSSVIERCSIGMTENLGYIPEELKQDIFLTENSQLHQYLFTKFVNEDCRTEFEKNVRDVLQSFNIRVDNLNMLSPTLVVALFHTCIIRRSDPKKLVIDEALYRHFLEAGRIHHPLSVNVWPSILNMCKQSDSGIERCSEGLRIEESFSNMAEQINNYYLKPETRCLQVNKYEMIQKSHYMNDDLMDETVQGSVQNLTLPPEQLKKMNTEWVQTFLNLASKTSGSIFMACGMSHFYSKAQNEALPSILDILKTKGYQIRRVQQVDCINEQETAHYVKLGS